jgi:hypothetical protein
MGYTFRIGNAVPKHSKEDFPYLHAKWEVEPATDPQAPTFLNDEMTGNGNSRSPSYTVWANFCREAGIYGLFYDERGHLLAGHPGCIGIDQDFADGIALALRRVRAASTLPAGFTDWNYEGPDIVDATLARLMWLDFWVRWALEYCETPAIQNT